MMRSYLVILYAKDKYRWSKDNLDFIAIGSTYEEIVECVNRTVGFESLNTLHIFGDVVIMGFKDAGKNMAVTEYVDNKDNDSVETRIKNFCRQLGIEVPDET